jgi:hypothetical protein
MDELGLTSSPTVNKSDCSPLNTNRQRIDSETVIQQSDVSSSRPALLAHDALGPLLFEVGGKLIIFNTSFSKQQNQACLIFLQKKKKKELVIIISPP